MTAEIIQFQTGRPVVRTKGGNQITAWVPEYIARPVDGIGVRSWTGREVLCRLTRNPNYRENPSVYPYENPYIYEAIGASWDPVKRDAPPPPCTVDKFDWDAFEREAVRA